MSENFDPNFITAPRTPESLIKVFEPAPKVKIFNDAMTSEDIDRSYGNSPYFFYNHYPEEIKEENVETSEAAALAKTA